MWSVKCTQESAKASKPSETKTTKAVSSMESKSKVDSKKEMVAMSSWQLAIPGNLAKVVAISHDKIVAINGKGACYMISRKTE